MKSSAFTFDEYELAYPDGIENHYWAKSRISILGKNLEQFDLTKKKILEIGCGKGIVVRALRNQNINCLGVELADVTPLPDVKNFVICNQEANKLDESLRNSIEVVLLLDVIEHIKNVEPFFEEIKKSFVNTKWIVITVPARKELWSNYDEFYGHFSRYDLGMTATLSKAIGYKLVKHRYFFSALYWVALASLKISGKREIRVVAPAGLMILLHQIIASILYLEYLILPGKFRGSSIIAMYKAD